MPRRESGSATWISFRNAVEDQPANDWEQRKVVYVADRFFGGKHFPRALALVRLMATGRVFPGAATSASIAEVLGTMRSLIGNCEPVDHPVVAENLQSIRDWCASTKPERPTPQIAMMIQRCIVEIELIALGGDVCKVAKMKRHQADGFIQTHGDPKAVQERREWCIARVDALVAERTAIMVAYDLVAEEWNTEHPDRSIKSPTVRRYVAQRHQNQE